MFSNNSRFFSEFPGCRNCFPGLSRISVHFPTIFLCLPAFSWVLCDFPAHSLRLLTFRPENPNQKQSLQEGGGHLRFMLS